MKMLMKNQKDLPWEAHLEVFSYMRGNQLNERRQTDGMVKQRLKQLPLELFRTPINLIK
jgi:hypothetical protein